MLTLSLGERGTLSLYEFVYRSIRDGIREGRLRPGEKLPSKRALAEHNGISVITVENAYGQLLSEGYILSRPRQGFFVADLPPMPEGKPRELPQSEPEDRPRVWMADLTSNRTRQEDFPFSAWSRVVRHILTEDREKLMQNPPWGGLKELREAIAGHLETFRGMRVRAEQILIGAGTEYLYGLLLQLLGPERVYAVEDPGYDRIGRIYRSHGARCVAIPMDGAGIRTDRLRREGVEVVHISPAHHFPTGKVMPVTRRHELLEWAGEERYIIEDDYDSEFRMVGLPIPTLQSIDTRERVIYMNTFSKTLASTVRISYMVLPEHLLERYREKLSFYSCTVSTFEQQTLARFIREGNFEKHLNRMRTDYHRRRDLLLTLFREHQDAEKIRISEEDAGLHFLITVDTKLSDEEICRLAAEEGIRVNPLSGYYAEKRSDSLHRFIVNYSSLNPDRMPAVVDGLYRILET